MEKKLVHSCEKILIIYTVFIMKEKNKEKNDELELMDKIVSLCKRRGFVYPSSEIYGGFAGVYDFGPLGVELENNLKAHWWKWMVHKRSDIVGLDSSIFMNPKIWEASGHTKGFSDPLAECKECNTRIRVDKVLEEINVKNVLDSQHLKLPFGIAQIGKAFRNEIAPRQFLFRTREFEQMEMQYLTRSEEEMVEYEKLRQYRWKAMLSLGLKEENLKWHKHDNLVFYAKEAYDIEYNYPWGFDEIEGVHARGDYDLTQHSKGSGQELTYQDPETNEKFIPRIIESSIGVGRLFFAVLCDAYTEDVMGDEARVYLKLKPSIAPIKVAVFPLLKNKPDLVNKAKEVFAMLNEEINPITFDDNGNVGKRYRRQDEIGTPFCVTVDFDTLEKDDTITVRDRDTGKQERVAVKELIKYLK